MEWDLSGGFNKLKLLVVKQSEIQKKELSITNFSMILVFLGGDDLIDTQSEHKGQAGRRKTIADLENQKFKKKEVDNLESNFRKNFRSFAISKFCFRIVSPKFKTFLGDK